MIVPEAVVLARLKSEGPKKVDVRATRDVARRPERPSANADAFDAPRLAIVTGWPTPLASTPAGHQKRCESQRLADPSGETLRFAWVTLELPGESMSSSTK